jgi:hypothetical protein
MKRPKAAKPGSKEGSKTASAASTAAGSAASTREGGLGVNIPNAVLGITLGCLIVFGFGFVGRGSSDPHHGHGAHGAPGGGGGGGVANVFGNALQGASHLLGGGDPATAADPNHVPGADPPPAEAGAKLVEGKCKCARHCLHVSCRRIVMSTAIDLTTEPPVTNKSHGKKGAHGHHETTHLPAVTRAPQISEGHKGERELNLLSQSIEFGRCRADSCSKKGAHCVAESLLTERTRCSATQRFMANKVRKCLIPTLRAPKSFTLERDSVSGLDVVCRGDVAVETCRSLDSASKMQFQEISLMIKSLLEHSEKGVAFVDFGDTDALLDVRVAAIPNVTVKVLSANPEQRNVAHLTGCINGLPSNRLYVTRHNFSVTETRNKKVAFEHVRNQPTMLRINAPGYEEVLAAELATTVEKTRPAVIITIGDAKLLGEWLMSQDYLAYNPKTCRFANGVESLSKVGLATTRKAVTMWVTEATKAIVVPQCKEACLVPSCQDGWRTEYRPCASTEHCTSDDFEDEAEKRMQDGCYWKNNAAACKLDSNWQRVVRCADPALPVATFSIVDVRGVLLACRGERDCIGVDTKIHDFTMNLLTSFFNQIQDTRRYTPEYVSIGSFVGLLGFAVAKHGVDVHIFEPVPTSRQWLKISRCVNTLGNVRVYDTGVGISDEDCTISANAQALEGNINVTCPAPPAALRLSDEEHSLDVVVPFRTLNTVLRHWKFEAATQPNAKQGKTRGFVLHFDDTVDALPLLQGADRWLNDEDWKPAVIVIPSTAADTDLIDAFVSRWGYHAAAMEGDVPAGNAGYRVYISMAVHSPE